MGIEVLAVPEDYLDQVISVIRRGLDSSWDIDEVVRDALTDWCDQEEEYIYGD